MKTHHKQPIFAKVKTKTNVESTNKKQHQDQRYIEGIAQGDEKTLLEIYRIFRPRIEKLIRQNKGTKEDARDIFNIGLKIIFLQTQKKNLEIEVSFYSYLRTICYRRWLNQLIQQNKYNADIDSLSESASDESVLKDITQSEKILFCRRQFSRLPERCREILALKFGGLTYKDVAEKLNLNESYTRRRGSQCTGELVALAKNDPEFNDFID